MRTMYVAKTKKIDDKELKNEFKNHEHENKLTSWANGVSLVYVLQWG